MIECLIISVKKSDHSVQEILFLVLFFSFQ